MSIKGIMTTRLYYDQSMLIRLAHRLYSDFQYFFIGFAKILHRRFQLEAHVHDPAPHKYGKIFGSRRRFQSFSTKKSISTFSAKR